MRQRRLLHICMSGSPSMSHTEQQYVSAFRAKDQSDSPWFLLGLASWNLHDRWVLSWASWQCHEHVAPAEAGTNNRKRRKEGGTNFSNVQDTGSRRSLPDEVPLFHRDGLQASQLG